MSKKIKAKKMYVGKGNKSPDNNLRIRRNVPKSITTPKNNFPKEVKKPKDQI